MSAKIKVEFSINNKSNVQQNSSKPFFIQNQSLKKKQSSPNPKYIFSFQEIREPHAFEEKETFHINRQASKDIQGNKRPSTSKKTSKGKTARGVSTLSSQKKNHQLKKNTSDKLKKTKKKIVGIDHSNFIDQQCLRSSLPGLSGKKVLQRFAPRLSQNQKIELINEKTVYYIGISSIGQDNLQGTYLWKKHEQIGYRYELIDRLGSGAFGQVVKAFDHKHKQMVAVKIIKSKTQHMQLALNQINILMKIKQQDIENKKNILRIKDFIVFRKHICIITELLTMSLYQLIESNNFNPIQTHNIRAFAIQILSSLSFLKQLNIIHSDLKPENILMKNKSKVGIKIIDFGTSMFLHEANFLYIQSRFYRAPEIILGAAYDFAIDMWSFGCLLAQLYLGYPLFAGDNQQQQLSLIMKAVGLPTKQYLRNCKNTGKYFGKDLNPKIIKGKDGKAIIPSSCPLSHFIENIQLCSFLSKILTLNPQERLTPLEALIQPWIIEYFPEEIKKQHFNEITLKIKQENNLAIERKKNLGKASLPTYKNHKKRNSDFNGGSHHSHRRRGSEGVF